MQKQINSVQSDLNQQIDTVQSELKKVSQEIKTETSKVQQNEKQSGGLSVDGAPPLLDCKGLLQELMTLMWQEVSSARKAATDERARAKAMESEVAQMKSENEKMRRQAENAAGQLKVAVKEAEEARDATIMMTRRAEAAEQQVADLLRQLEAERDKSAQAGTLSEQVAGLERERDALTARQTELEAQLAASTAELTLAMQKLEAFSGAAQELEDMKKALQAEVEAVWSIPQTPGHDCLLTASVALHRLNGRCAGRSTQCSQS